TSARFRFESRSATDQASQEVQQLSGAENWTDVGGFLDADYHLHPQHVPELAGPDLVAGSCHDDPQVLSCSHHLGAELGRTGNKVSEGPHLAAELGRMGGFC